MHHQVERETDEADLVRVRVRVRDRVRDRVRVRLESRAPWSVGNVGHATAEPLRKRPTWLGLGLGLGLGRGLGTGLGLGLGFAS